MMTFGEIVDFIYSKRAGETKIKVGLERIQKLCELLDNPQDSFKVIHVAGTNGKGSVTSCLTQIFMAAGYKTGTFISPHLITINERIRVNNEHISEDDFVRMFDKLQPAIKIMDEMSEEMSPSFFEIITAIAFLYYKEKNIDMAIVEVGLGGRFDATNVVKSDVAVITNIQFDHMKILGDTLEKIAFEKAGIIKKDNYLVLGNIKESAREVILNRADEVGTAKKYIFNQDFYYSNEKLQLNNNTIDFKGINSYESLKYLSNGSYQPHNVSVAIASYEAYCMKNNIEIDEEILRKGLNNFAWEGRFEVIEREGKKIILEGAHNEDGVKAFCDTIDIYMPETKRVALIGILNDKDFSHMAKVLSKKFNKIIITGIATQRSTDPEAVYREFVKDAEPGTEIEFVLKAEDGLKKLLEEKADYYFVSGSLYLVGEIRGILIK